MRLLFAGVTVLLASSVAVAPAEAATTVAQPKALPLTDVAYSTNAYGTDITGVLADSGIRSGVTAATGLGCTTRVGLTSHNDVASVDLKVIKTGAVRSKSETIGSATGRTARSSSSVSGLSVLGGLITATTVSSTTTSSLNSVGYASGTNRSTLLGLKIGGVSVSASTAPNTTIALKSAGNTIGRVVVNEQTKSKSGGTVTGITRALDVTLTTATLGLKAGARIIIGHSRAELEGAPAGFAAGDGYALKTTLADGAVQSGPLAYQSVPCMGGGRSASVASGSVPSILSLGAAKTSTHSDIQPGLTDTASNTLASASVLNGLISATNIKASTTTTRETKTATPVLTDNSTFGALKVAGVPLITPSVEPNTTISLPGLGKITFHKVTRTRTGIKVVMINIVLGNALGALPTGSTIELGVSETSVR